MEWVAYLLFCLGRSHDFPPLRYRGVSVRLRCVKCGKEKP